MSTTIHSVARIVLKDGLYWVQVLSPHGRFIPHACACTRSEAEQQLAMLRKMEAVQ